MIVCAYLCLIQLPPLNADEDAHVKSSTQLKTIKVSGMGWNHNRQLKKAVQVVLKEDTKGTLLDIALLEDMLWILDGEIRRKGYLKPQINVSIMGQGSRRQRLHWTKEKGFSELPKPTTTGYTLLKFSVNPGVLYYYNDVSIDEVSFLKPEKIESFFYPTEGWLIGQKDRYFTTARFEQSLEQMIAFLKEQGYYEAKVISKHNEIDETTGAVSTTVELSPGKVHYVGKVVFDLESDNAELATLPPESFDQQLFTPSWLSTYLFSVRQRYQSEGYVDVKLDPQFQSSSTDESLSIDLQIKIKTGTQKIIGEISFDDAEDIKSSLLDRQLLIETGQPLDLIKVEQSRDRLSKLGAFKSIDTRYEDQDRFTKDVTFEFERKPQDTVSLSVGIGSFDIVRGGVSWERTNLWHRAHHNQLEALQSLRMTQVDYTYSVPQLLGSDVELFAKTDFLRREEVSFDRREWGGSIGATYPWLAYNTQFALQYNFENLSVTQQNFDLEDGRQEATVTSLEFSARKTEFDNTIYPTQGYQLFTTLELALPEIGGQVEYQRLEFGGAYHQPFSGGFIARLGIRHGFITSFGAQAENIPLNRRFFLGGENTVRSYRQGEASPLDDDGQEIGAGVYTLIQVEAEQKLNQTLSIVLFSDTIGFAEDFSEYGSPEWLFNIGVGLRMRTFLGPLRLEYGHNLNPRPTDRRGSAQFSIGMPF